MTETVDFIKVNENFEEDLKSLVLDNFKNKENYMKLISIISDIFSECESLIVSVSEGRMLYSAVGEQLTEIGRQQGLARFTEDDSVFRSTIIINSLRKKSSGTRDEVVDSIIKAIGTVPAIYVGLYKVVDITVLFECIIAPELVEEIVKSLPINTAYRIVARPEYAFGFDGDDSAAGFASRYAGQGAPGECGGWSSLKAQVVMGNKSAKHLPYVQPGYVDAGYAVP